MSHEWAQLNTVVSRWGEDYKVEDNKVEDYKVEDYLASLDRMESSCEDFNIYSDQHRESL